MEIILLAKKPGCEWTVQVGARCVYGYVCVSVRPMKLKPGAALLLILICTVDVMALSVVSMVWTAHTDSMLKPMLQCSPFNRFRWQSRLQPHNQDRRILGHILQAPCSIGRQSRALSTCPSYLSFSLGCESARQERPGLPSFGSPDLVTRP